MITKNEETIEVMFNENEISKVEKEINKSTSKIIKEEDNGCKCSQVECSS